MKIVENKYRIGYDKVFLAHPWIKSENKFISGVSLTILYKLLDLKTGEEITFTDLEDHSIGHDFYMNDFVKCSFDESSENYIKLSDKNQQALDLLGYKLEYEIIDYTKDGTSDENASCVDCEDISKEEFYNILNKYKENFNNIDNKPAQSCSYVSVPIVNKISKLEEKL